MNWADVLNPAATAIKKTLFQLLQARYSENERIVERLIPHLHTEEDIRSFLKLMSDSWELGYMKSINDHKDALKKAGLVARITSAPDQTKAG